MVPASSPSETYPRRAGAGWRRISQDSRSSSTGISSILLGCRLPIKFLGMHAQRTEAIRALRRIAVSRQRVKRKIIAVQVIFQVEDTRKPRAGKFLFGPRAVGLLPLQQVQDGARHRQIAGVAGRQQSNQSPGRLRGRAYALAFERSVVVGSDGFPKAAISVLNFSQPFHGSLAVAASGERNRFERAQHAAGPVNVVDTPASEPRPLAGLVFQ